MTEAGASPRELLTTKLEQKTATIAVVGIGYVGLPLAVAFAEKGFRVVGIDTNRDRVDALRRGESYVEDVPSTTLRSLHNMEATSEQSVLTEADVVLICVPTPLTKTKDPNLMYVVQEATEVAKYLHSGQLVILESTTYPGTTRDILLPLLQEAGQEKGLRCGEDYFLAYSPEMVDPGNKQFGLRNTPKVVAGADEPSRELAEKVYQQVAEVVVPVSSLEAAEMVKVFSNVFRSVNIALVNELAQLCQSMGVSVWEVLHTTERKPFGYMPFFPGPGIGGHCIPCDPYYLSCKAREYDFHARFIELAAETNERMPYYVVEQVKRALNARGRPLRNSRVLVLGAAYKRDTRDTRESPAVKLIHLLMKEWAEAHYHDPFAVSVELPSGNTIRSIKNYRFLQAYDCVVLAVDHSDYVRDREYLVKHSRLLYDTKGVTYGMGAASNVVRLGE